MTINHYKCLGCSLTHLCPVDSPILLNWINLFPKLGMSSIFISIFRIFLTEIPLSKQRRPWWDAASYSVSSGSTLFAKAFFLDARHKWVKGCLNQSIACDGDIIKSMTENITTQTEWCKDIFLLWRIVVLLSATQCLCTLLGHDFYISWFTKPPTLIFGKWEKK